MARPRVYTCTVCSKLAIGSLTHAPKGWTEDYCTGCLRKRSALRAAGKLPPVDMTTMRRRP